VDAPKRIQIILCKMIEGEWNNNSLRSIPAGSFLIPIEKPGSMKLVRYLEGGVGVGA